MSELLTNEEILKALNDDGDNMLSEFKLRDARIIESLVIRHHRGITMYDKEFEELWNSRYAWPAVKKTYYEFWQAAKSLKPEKKKIELEGGRYIIAPKDGFVDAGLSRKTEADAIKARDMITRSNRLAAFVYEHCGVEGEFGEECYCYIYSNFEGVYKWTDDDEFPDLFKQYMPKDTAIWLCEKLNSGEIVL